MPANQLIKLTVSKRRGETPQTPNYIFDVDDIVSPIRSTGESSYFTARMLKGTDSQSRNLAKVDYIVMHTLDAIKLKSSKLVKLLVKKRRGANGYSTPLKFIVGELTFLNSLINAVLEVLSGCNTWYSLSIPDNK